VRERDCKAGALPAELHAFRDSYSGATGRTGQERCDCDVSMRTIATLQAAKKPSGERNRLAKGEQKSGTSRLHEFLE
jgi:hypothetical protein